MINRRNFISSTAALGAGVALAPLLSFGETPLKSKKIKLPDNGVILFQGDSITDAGRDKNNLNHNSLPAWGAGYMALTGAQLLADHPQKKLKIYNKGISGNRVPALAERWDKDCLELRPDILSIMIGVNDYWHTKTNGYKGTLQSYKTDYMSLLQRTKDKFPDLQIILAEPFGVKGIRHVDESWYPYFDAYREASREVATHFGAIFIPTQEVFDKAQLAMPGSFWTGDGVHPGFAGIQLMAHAWLKAFGAG